jgi:hypothetical protein
MNKKFLSAILFGALMVTSTGTFVSCKDYDDDIEDLQAQIDKKASIEELQSKLTALTTDLEAAKKAAEDAKQAAEDAKDEVAGAAADAKKAAVEAAEAKVKEMQKELEDAINSKLDDVNALIAKVNALVSEVSNIVGKRLTNLVFIPSTYIDGIEAIKFSTLTYKPWTNLLADNTDGVTDVTINDGKTAVEYLVSPSTLKAENIKSVGIVANTATNIQNPSARVATAAPIDATIDGEIVNGVLKLNLKKTQEESFGGSDNNKSFTIVALKAEAQLTAEEEKQGVDPFVYSDWARLYEEAVTPYIHYNKYKITPEATEDLENGVVPHFYPYTKIHDGVKADDINNTEGKYIIENLPYTQSLNLNTLVKVCDKNGTEYNPANYGLKFEFALVDYYLKDTSADEQKTNQKEFAAISSEGKLTSQARNGATNNKDAIGREPMIQVVLKDINNGGNKVVDVRYFKVKWTTANSQKPLNVLKEFTADYECGKEYDNTVLTADMNDKIYAAINISKEDFHRLYELDQNIYASEDAVKAGTPASTVLGTLTDVKASGSTTTHNLNWVFNISTNAAIQSEYAAGKAEREVYGRYVNVNDPNDFYYFSLKLTLNIKKMTLARGYFQGNWNVSGDALTAANADKTFQVNPSLTSDAMFGTAANYTDCQLIADLKDGYFEKPAAILDLVKNAETADFVFDAARVSAVLGDGWSVSVDRKSLLKGLEVAAVIDVNEAGEAFIALNETSRGKNGQPTAAACELIGKNVPVKLAAEYCALTQDVDNFLVNFMTPLAVTIANPEDHFHDLVTGGSAISVKGLASISEVFGLKRLIIGMKDNAEYKDDELISWYKVQDINWAASEAKTNLEVKTNADGTKSLIIGTGKNTKWSDITAIYPKMKLTFDAAKQALVYNNAGGTHLQQSFELYIPVKVQTKWGTVVKEITVVVDPD